VTEGRERRSAGTPATSAGASLAADDLVRLTGAILATIGRAST